MSAGKPQLDASQQRHVDRAREILATEPLAIAAHAGVVIKDGDEFAYGFGVACATIRSLLDVIEQLAEAAPARPGDPAGQTTPEPEADPVPWPTGFCGDPVPPGAWAAGFTVCRDHVATRSSEMLAVYDAAATPNLTVVDTPARPGDLDDTDGES